MSTSKIIQIIPAPVGMKAEFSVASRRSGDWVDRDRAHEVACLALCEDGSIVGVMLSELERPRRVSKMVESPPPDIVWDWCCYSMRGGSS